LAEHQAQLPAALLNLDTAQSRHEPPVSCSGSFGI
jgi:hypothetical protein